MSEKYTPTDVEVEMAAAISALHAAVFKLVSRLELSEQEQFTDDLNEAAESVQRIVSMWNLRS